MKIYYSIIVMLFVLACGGGEQALKPIDKLPTVEKAYSKTSNLYINLPSKWFVAEDNECNCTDLWIVKNDLSASIAFKKININNNPGKENSAEEIEKIAGYSKAFVAAKLSVGFKDLNDEKTFELGGKFFSAYKYQNAEKYFIRTVVFKHHGDFYECEAVSKNHDKAEDLYSLQNAILSALN